MNMLSAKKVRLHGMRSSRWTTRDKLVQYKGLINLYTRDRKILSFDTTVARKKQVKELKQLRKDIKTNRADFDNAANGDRQQLRNTLADHRDLQLAFAQSSPLKVIDHVHQGNFNKRKLLDRMDYRMKQKTQTLVDLKLELAELEDRLKYESPGQIPIEKEAQLITGKVQNAILKQDAALSVRNTYRNILNILKKDCIFFDVVLETLKLDGFIQSKCMVRTTELGQLATEYLDDRKQEFKELERAVKQDMKAREATLKLVRLEVETVTNNMALLIRRDSDINLGKVLIPRTTEDLSLEKDIEHIQNILLYLQNTVYVSNFDHIYPCLIEQRRQSERLLEFLGRLTADRDNLASKKKHGEIMHNQLLYTMIETTFEYKSEKARLLAEIEAQSKRNKGAHSVGLQQGKLLVKVRASLHQLSQKCLIIKATSDEKATAKIALIEPPATYSKKMSVGFIYPPTEFVQDGLKIISLLEPKLNILMNNALPALDDDKKDEAYKFFQQFTAETCSVIKYEEFVVDESLVTDVVLEDSQVPNYYDIKAKSKELVEISTVNEDLIPMFAPKKKKLKLK